MAEADVQKVELDQMRLEDAEATTLSKLEEAQRRKQDYSTYYGLAVRYGPLPGEKFDLATYPGSHYHGKILDATRVIQIWWWSVWPPLLRHRKAAALAIQSQFRGFLQRQKWRAIIRLRTLWGNTRIVTHSFVVWRITITTALRVKTFTGRLSNRRKGRVFGALLSNAQERRAAREELLRQRIRRVSEGVRLRVFESWDFRVRGLIDVEQRRLDRLRAALDRHTPSIKKNALAFLGTAAGKEAVASTLATAPPASESEAEAKQEMVRRFVWREQALMRHDFNTTSPPPPLCCPRSDSCDATFVDRGHALRHAADVHPTDSPGVAELSVTMRDPVGLAVFEEFVEAAAVAAEPDGKGSFTRQASSDEQPPVKQSDQGSTPASSVGAAARDTLDVWKAIQAWRLISSDQKRFQQLGEAIILSRTKYPHLPDDVRVALGGEQLRRLFGELGATHGGKPNKKLLPGRGNHTSTLQRPSPPRSGDDARVTTVVEPSALEEASFRAVAFLSECQVGLAFLGSSAYRTYLDGVHKPMRNAVEAASAEIAAAEEAEWAAEAHSLRKAALDREQEAQVECLANQATRLVLQGAVGASLLGGLIDDQASLLAVVIIAERSTFAKVISAVWNETVDEAAHLIALEDREIDPGVASALSEAACSFARSRIMDELIDQCGVDLTGPEGDLWADARPMEAVADGLGYQVRSKVMSELVDEAVSELAASGEAEELMSEAALARRRREDELREGGEAKDEADGIAGAGDVVASGGGGKASEEMASLGARTTDDDGGSRRHSTATAVAASSSALVLVGADEVRGGLEEAGGTDGEGRRESSVDRTGGSSGRSSVGSTLAETEAAVLMQSALRRKAAYREMKKVVAQNFIRMYDPGEGAFYWYNQATMESTWDKPVIIDLYFKKPVVAKSTYLFREASTGGSRRSVVDGFESRRVSS
ncbi:hypothetical protein Esi_0002_0053 [Ectocarpus siliculosus]|uniref:WW domain-containing protein n=1 Tax=Ectocarpus siliculosus TaxID=2880 RepID=D7FPZ0_ECTSI|nr:hypothetical protein Esi_0002_0053 [Ectocarpus siliculosus]|eukprot:CBJ48322.1 hypothetical protein Esi_0002_0053 [Ectocarpus siliculosus]